MSTSIRTFLKLFSFVLALSFQGNVVSAASVVPESALKSLKGVYDTVSAEDLVDHNYYLNFGFESGALKDALKNSTACQKPTAFESVTAVSVIARIRGEALEGLNKVRSTLGHERFQAQSQLLDDSLIELLAFLQGQDLRLCIDSSAGPYSDGHLTRFLKVDQQLVLMFEVGYPD
jgi:hypothetical protein